MSTIIVLYHLSIMFVYIVIFYFSLLSQHIYISSNIHMDIFILCQNYTATKLFQWTFVYIAIFHYSPYTHKSKKRGQ